MRILVPVCFSLCIAATSASAESPKATGNLNCKAIQGATLFPCPFVAYREGPGAARVDITFPDGTLRHQHLQGWKKCQYQWRNLFFRRESETLPPSALALKATKLSTPSPSVADVNSTGRTRP